MDQRDIINLAQKALKLVNDTDEDQKEEGLSLLDQILGRKDEQLVALGYEQVILKELVKLAQFEVGKSLDKILRLLEKYYFGKQQNHDELLETLVYKVARSNDQEVCRICLQSISLLLDCFDEAIAKHSKQLLRLADLNDITCLNPIISEILTKMKSKLPKRKDISN